jgi:hypothetical protein
MLLALFRERLSLPPRRRSASFNSPGFAPSSGIGGEIFKTAYADCADERYWQA